MMDRKHCVLFYSKFSPASKELMETIESLPYDLPRLTGMTLMCVDAVNVRRIVSQHGLNVVPCLFVQYFDGETQLLTEQLIYDWINEVSQAVSPSSSKEEIEEEKSPHHRPLQAAPVDKKIDVLSLAMSMQKSREASDSEAVGGGVKKHV